jgi:hypothetical protein
MGKLPRKLEKSFRSRAAGCVESAQHRGRAATGPKPWRGGWEVPCLFAALPQRGLRRSVRPAQGVLNVNIHSLTSQFGPVLAASSVV